MYHFTKFTLLLNDPVFINDSLPRTDSRFRPDVRLLEQKKIGKFLFCEISFGFLWPSWVLKGIGK